MSDVRLNIQKRIYALLTGDATLMAKITGVFDFVPDNQAYPFVQIGEAEATDWSSHTFNGFDVLLQFNVWHRPGSRGRAPVLDIQNDLYRILHDQPLGVPDVDQIVMRFQTATVLVDPDAVTYHGISRYRLLLGGK